MERGDAEALAQAEKDDVWSLEWAQNTYDYEPDDETDNVEDLFGSALYPCFGADDRRKDYGIQLIEEKNTDGFLRGRLVGDDIDMNVVKRFIERCQRLHGDHCASRSSHMSPTSARHLEEFVVIDVVSLCLRKLPADASYAALSYVWGDSNKPVTLASNKAIFSEPQGLQVRLPQTVQDAMDVTKALGLQFIWIDSLCITQDGAEEKQILIKHMDSIYANAAVTLVAATGNGADAGLSAWSNKHGRDQHCMDLEPNFRLGVLPYYQRELLECKHASRAWT
jgi:hypothetical protein